MKYPFSWLCIHSKQKDVLGIYWLLGQRTYRTKFDFTEWFTLDYGLAHNYLAGRQKCCGGRSRPWHARQETETEEEALVVGPGQDLLSRVSSQDADMARSVPQSSPMTSQANPSMSP